MNYRSIPIVKRFARWTWRRRVDVLRVLHWNDPFTPIDTCINLECLWWKVLSTTDPASPCWEPEGYTYDMLPRPGRRLVTALRLWHPRWIHALLEVRMAYLSQAIANEMEERVKNTTKTTRVISLGSGYDVRSIRMLQQQQQNTFQKLECYEFDLSSTVESKRKVFRERLLKRQRLKGGHELTFPTMVGMDLNDSERFRQELNNILNNDPKEVYTIFVVEGVLMYLQGGKASAILQACAETVTKNGGTASLCFADRLFDQSNCDLLPIQRQFQNVGWTLTEWAPNPNANAKHMGIAKTTTMTTIAPTAS